MNFVLKSKLLNPPEASFYRHTFFVPKKKSSEAEKRVISWAFLPLITCPF